MEVNVKGLLMDTFWLGVGRRFNYANSLQAGYLIGNVRVGYVFEYPIASSRQFLGNTHEFMVFLKIFGEQGENKLW